MLGFLKKLFGGNGAPSFQDNRPPWPAVPSQNRAEPGLRENEDHFRQLVAGVRDYAVFLLDPQGTVLTWNCGAERIKGYRPEDIIGRHFSRFYPREAVASGWPAHELKVAESTGRFEDEGWRVRKDGSRFWANVVITALRGENGELRGFLKITRDLTDRKQAEEKLRHSEERFRLMVESVRDYAIFMLDPQGRVATWNAGAERLKGYTADEIIGEHFSRFYPAETIARGWPDEELRRAIADGRIEDEGWRMRKDGSRFWANVVITALYDENGALRGFAKVTRDLTERRAAEENARRLIQEEAARTAAEHAAREIARQREQLRITLTSIGDAVVVTDGKGVVTFMNPVAAELTGWQQDEALGLPLNQVFHIINEETRQLVNNPVDTVFRERRVVELANYTALVGKSGRVVPIEDSAAPIPGENGELGGAVLVFRDVSESRRAMEVRSYLAAIVDSSDDAIIGHTLDGQIASWNRGAERIYGYTAEETVGKPLSLLVPPDHPDEQPTILGRLARGESIEHFETKRVRKDGSRVDVSLTLSPVRDSEGKVIGASKIARDITVRREEERRKDEFLAVLAHELRNPLAPIRNALQVMQLADKDLETLAQARSMMERQIQHMVRLVDDLLDISRISRGKLTLRKERIAIADIVAHTLEVCETLVNEGGQKLTVTQPDKPIVVDADRTRLAQAICNLLSNAVKYSARGSHIELAVERQENEAVIRVTDTGVGISPEMLPRVFDMFWQVDRTLERSQGGLGVGLTIVKRLIEMHGGSVEARSEGYGHGSEFIIRLPVVPSAETQKGEHIAGRKSPPSARRRVLVADDNVDSAHSLAKILTLLGHEVRVAHDGEEAVEAGSAFHPNVVFLDIGMPRLNGYDAARRIREQPWGKSVVLVAVTGWGQEDDKRQSIAAGIDFHIVKPIEPAILEQLLAGASPTST